MKLIINENQFISLLESQSDVKHKEALDKTGFWGTTGAGCIIMANSTGRVLLSKRSKEVRETGTWGTWGGAVDEGESPIETVKREVSEETGYNGPMQIIPLHIFHHESGFEYNNFLAIVNNEFRPNLNYETEKAYWFYIDELPKPLHFGIKSIFSNPNDIKIISKFQIVNKSISEAKDYVYGKYKGKTIETSNEDWDAIPFVYFNNKVYVGYNPELGIDYKEAGYLDDNDEDDYPNFHSDIMGFYEFMHGIDNVELPKRRGTYDYLGRIWFDRNVISFWKYPEDINILKKILTLLKQELNKIYDFDIDFGDYIIDINTEDSNELISINDYIAGNNASEEEMVAPHLMPSNQKANTPQMKAAMDAKYKNIGDKLGSTTQAEYNYYKNYGLGDSYIPNKELIEGIVRKILKNKLNESVSDVVYHYTYPTNLVNILKTNTINLAPSYGISADQSLNYNKLFSLSLTTARNSTTGYHSSGKDPNNAKGKVRLQMNGRELNYNYKSKHVDYWQYPRTKEFTKNGGSYDEMEDRLLSDKNHISNASRYITAIEIFIDERQMKYYHEIQDLVKKYNIPCYFYNNGRDFNFSLKQNAVQLPTEYEQTNEYNPNNTEQEEKMNTIMRIMKLAGMVSYGDPTLKNKILEYAKQNGFDVEKLNSVIDERIKTLKYSYLGNPSDYMMAELRSVMSAEVGNHRSTTDNFIRYVIMLMGRDMKKNGLNTINDYIWYKAYIGKKTQKQFNEQFYKKILTIINTNYIKQVENINSRSYYDLQEEYHDGYVMELPEFKSQFDNIIIKIKDYYKEKIMSNDDMFRYYFYFAYTEVMQYLNLHNYDYELAKNLIDYENSNLDKYDVESAIRNIIGEVSDFAMEEIKRMQDEYLAQQNRD